MTKRMVRLISGRAMVLATLAAMVLAANAGVAQTLTTPSAGTGIGSARPAAPSAERTTPSENFKLSAVPQDFSKLKLAPGDLVNIAVFSGEDFSGPSRLDQDGTVTIPFAGRVKIAGHTIAEAQQLIADRLVEAELFKAPQVQITVVEYTAPMVTILGEVGSPGQYPLLAEKKFTDVLALAGGLTPTAGDSIEIHRAGEPAIKLRYSRGSSPSEVANVTVKPGDLIQVARAGVVYVLGAVNRPGGYLMQEDGKLDAIQAIAMAFGAALQASVGDIRVIRRAPNGEILQIPVPYKKSMQAKAAPVMLLPEDVVYVPPSKVKTVLLDSQSILSSAASAAIINGMR